MTRLLLGNMPPRLGHLRPDGMDVVPWDPEVAGQYCGYLPQDPELFSSSVREVIARNDGKPDTVAAAQLVGCHGTIVRFPAGKPVPSLRHPGHGPMPCPETIISVTSSRMISRGGCTARGGERPR